MMLPLTKCSALLLLASYTAAQNPSFDHSLYTSSPPVYPSPNATGSGWDAAFAQASAFVRSLTLEEKVGLVTGDPFGPCIGNIAPIPRVGFQGLCLQDGPLAIRQATYASVFPAGLTAAASWDRNLMAQRGMQMAAEFKGKGAHIILGPVSGPLGRSGYGGRGWEGFSPDPYLTGVAMRETITALQQNGVQACAKHYIGNEQETQRNPSLSSGNVTIEAVSSNIDDRTLHELYLWPFADAVHAGVSSIMCAYNRVNQSYSCHNSKLLNGVLKDELGFQGYVMSDWGATHAGVADAEAGLDMDMPGTIGFFVAGQSYFGGNLTAAVNNGSLPVQRLDDMARRVMTPYFHLQQNVNYPPIDPQESVLNVLQIQPVSQAYTYGPENVDVRDNHAQLIRDLGAAGAVLLKNTNNALPLRAPKNIGVFGNDAGEPTNGLYFISLSGSPLGYEFGTLPVGGGSGTGHFTYVITPLQAIQARALRDGAQVQYVLNNTLITLPGGLGSVAPRPPDVCLVFLKTWATEGFDRFSLLADWNSTAVVESIAASCPNTVVVTHNSGIEIMPWANNPNVTAIIAAHFPGQESGNSIVDVLYGDVNPSGKLPYTIAFNQSDYSFAPIANSTALQQTEDPNAWQSDFTERLLIDYRHFDYYNLPVQFEFGFGLSYTTFSMSNLSVSTVYCDGPISATPPPAPIAPGGNPNLYEVLFVAEAVVSNTGAVAGATVAQLYLSLPQVSGDQTPTPLRVLRGFEKVSLQPGQSATVTFDIMRRDISYWSTQQQEWVIAPGSIGAAAGFSSRDLRERTTFTI